jgi:chromosome segregation ATPase
MIKRPTTQGQIENTAPSGRSPSTTAKEAHQPASPKKQPTFSPPTSSEDLNIARTASSEQPVSTPPHTPVLGSGTLRQFSASEMLEVSVQADESKGRKDIIANMTGTAAPSPVLKDSPSAILDRAHGNYRNDQLYPRKGSDIMKNDKDVTKRLLDHVNNVTVLYSYIDPADKNKRIKDPGHIQTVDIFEAFQIRYDLCTAILKRQLAEILNTKPSENARIIVESLLDASTHDKQWDAIVVQASAKLKEKATATLQELQRLLEKVDFIKGKKALVKAFGESYSKKVKVSKEVGIEAYLLPIVEDDLVYFQEFEKELITQASDVDVIVDAKYRKDACAVVVDKHTDNEGEKHYQKQDYERLKLLIAIYRLENKRLRKDIEAYIRKADQSKEAASLARVESMRLRDEKTLLSSKSGSLILERDEIKDQFEAAVSKTLELEEEKAELAAEKEAMAALLKDEQNEHSKLILSTGELVKAYSNSRLENSSLTSKCQELEQENRSLDQSTALTIFANSLEIRGLENSLAQLKSVITQLKKDYKEAIDIIFYGGVESKELRATLESSTERQKELEQQIALLKENEGTSAEKIRSQIQVIEDSQEAIADLSRKVKDAEEQIALLKQQKQDEEKDNQALQEYNEEISRDFTEALEQATELAAFLTKADASHLQLQKENGVLSAHVSDLEGMISRQKTEIQIAEEKSEKAKAALLQKEVLLGVVTKGREQNQGMLEAQSQAHQEKQTALHSEINSLSAKAAAFSREIAELNDHVERSAKKQVELEQQLGQLHESEGASAEKILSQIQAIEASKEVVAELTRKVKDAEEQIALLNQQKQAEEKDNQALQKHCEEILSVCHAISAKLTEATKQIIALEASLTNETNDLALIDASRLQLQEENGVLSAQVNTLEKTISSQKAAIQTVEEETAKTKATLSEKESTLQSEKTLREQEQSKNSELEKKLQEMEARLATLQKDSEEKIQRQETEKANLASQLAQTQERYNEQAKVALKAKEQLGYESRHHHDEIVARDNSIASLEKKLTDNNTRLLKASELKKVELQQKNADESNRNETEKTKRAECINLKKKNLEARIEKLVELGVQRENFASKCQSLGIEDSDLEIVGLSKIMLDSAIPTKDQVTMTSKEYDAQIEELNGKWDSVNQAIQKEKEIHKKIQQFRFVSTDEAKATLTSAVKDWAQHTASQRKAPTWNLFAFLANTIKNYQDTLLVEAALKCLDKTTSKKQAEAVYFLFRKEVKKKNSIVPDLDNNAVAKTGIQVDDKKIIKNGLEVFNNVVIPTANAEKCTLDDYIAMQKIAQKKARK